MKPREAEELIQAALEGSTTREGITRLQELLRHDPDLRRIYWQYAFLQQALAYRFANQSTVMARRDRGLAIQRRKAMLASVITAVAAIICIGLVLQGFLIPPVLPPANFTAAPQTIFQVFHAADEAPPASTLVEGSTLVIEQGTVELRLARGSRGVVQAPARVTVEDKDVLRMDQGTGWFHVAEEDHGFLIRTPELEIRDLGTEFGVISTPAAHDEIHVFSGRVEARATGPRGAKTLLKAGEARRCDPIGRLVEIVPAPTTFLHSLPAELPYIAFGFDRVENERFEVNGNHPLADHITARRVGPSRPPKLVEGIAGMAIALDGQGEQILTDWPGIADSMPRTVSAWIRVDPAADLSDHPSIVGWGDPETSNGKWKVLLAQDAAGAPAVPRISLGGHAYDAPVTANDGRWHHLAVTFSGGMTEDDHPEIGIFFNGLRQALTYRHFPVFDGSRRPQTRTRFGAIPLSIGGPIDSKSGTFQGEIDELRIHFGVLPEEAIRNAARAPR